MKEKILKGTNDWCGLGPFLRKSEGGGQAVLSILLRLRFGDGGKESLTGGGAGTGWKHFKYRIYKCRKDKTEGGGVCQRGYRVGKKGEGGEVVQINGKGGGSGEGK